MRKQVHKEAEKAQVIRRKVIGENHRMNITSVMALARGNYTLFIADTGQE